MAIAEVYSKWSSQGAGVRGAGGWGRKGGPANAGGGGGVLAAAAHAEREAWREAWPVIRTHVRASRVNFPADRYEVKIWVDQQICPSCQKWMIVEVIAHLKQLSTAHAGLRVELYAEVRRMGVDKKTRVQRSTVWDNDIGLTARYQDLPADYNA